MNSDPKVLLFVSIVGFFLGITLLKKLAAFSPILFFIVIGVLIAYLINRTK